jgi:hypothetical protein
MNALSTTYSIELPQEILTQIFRHLSARDLAISSAVSHCWQNAADQDCLWKFHLHSPKVQVDFRQMYITQKKTEFFKNFPQELIQALGSDQTKMLPFQNMQGIRVLENGCLTLDEFSAPITIGRLSAIPLHMKSKEWKESDVTKYAFFAIRFINREFDPYDDSKHLNIWLTNGKMWTLITGGREDGWPTWFCGKDGTGMDFSRTIEYIGRLVRKEPCGIRDVCSPTEHSKITHEGKSTVELA